MLGGIHYYDESGKIYPTKTEAIKSKQKIGFYYHDDFFINQPWSIEPLETLEQLYKERAQWIRDNYDYVVICYSGGADSTNVLESFYYNNIHIDEIVMVGALSQDSQKGVDENHNGDLYHNCFPTLNKMNLQNTKISVFDYTLYFNDPNNYTLTRQYGPEYFHHLGTWSSPHHLFWHDLAQFVPGKGKTAYVFGSEKPNQTYNPETKKYTCRFSDLGICDYGFLYNYGNDGKRINFYSDPEAIKLMIKQNHVVKRYHDSFITVNNQYNQLRSVSKVYDIREALYSLRNPLVFESQKSTTTFLSVRDQYLLKSRNSDMFKIFQQAVMKIREFQEVSVQTYTYAALSREYQLN